MNTGQDNAAILLPGIDSETRARRRLLIVLATLLACIGAVRIISTYRVFNQTIDEPVHLACGIEWWYRGACTIVFDNPPLARITAALGPYLSGVRPQGLSRDEKFQEGNLELETNNGYWSNLTRARMGILPYYFLACIVVWIWTELAFGTRTALFAILLFTCIPMILGHSGLVTTDMAVTATLSAALFCYVLWLERPSLRNTVLLGITLGLALLSKFSALPFFPVCAASLLIGRVVMRYSRAGAAMALRKQLISMLAGVVIASLVVWAGYRFSVTRMIDDGGPEAQADQQRLEQLLGGHPSLLKAAETLGHTPLPGMEMARGIASVWYHNKEGNTANLLGEWSTTGWWYFFPVLLFFKTPLAFLILALAGSVLLIRTAKTRRTLLQIAPGLFILGILGMSLLGRIDIGVRHVLPVYPLLAIVAAHAVETGWARTKSVSLRVLNLGLVAWLVVASVLAHPDYMAYFNELASGRQERITVESDLDWGQDLQRLSDRLRQHGVQRLYLEYFGSADVARFNLPPFSRLSPYQEVQGWVAISRRSLELPTAAIAAEWPVNYSLPPGFKSTARAEGGPFSWLKAYSPIERVGSSIVLYHIDVLRGDCSIAPCGRLSK